MRFSTIFKSRWMACLWAAGIIWFALDVAGVAPAENIAGNQAVAATDVAGAPVTPEQEQALAGIIEGL